jgi:site-specific recombinase XerD
MPDKKDSFEFEKFITVAKLAATTKELYAHYLNLWGAFISRREITLKQARPIDAAEFLKDWPGWSDSTRYSAVCAIRSFYIWKFGVRHPLLEFNIIRSDPGPQPTPDLETLNKLLASLDTSTPCGKRHLAMLMLMLDTGLRATEVCRLDLEHLDMSKGILWVSRKGGKWKPARFFDYTVSCMASWLAVRPMFAKPEVKNVFVITMQPNAGEAMDRNTLRVLFYRLGERAKIGKFNPHQMRRAFATLAIDNGASSTLVQNAGGWSDIGMLQKYTQALNLERMRQFSPVDNLMGLHQKPQEGAGKKFDQREGIYG